MYNLFRKRGPLKKSEAKTH